MRKVYNFFGLMLLLALMTSSVSTDTSTFRVFPYLQVFDSGKFQLTWITNDAVSSDVELYDDQGNLILTETVSAELMPEIFYTSVEQNEVIDGLTQGSWLGAAQGYKQVLEFPELQPGAVYTYIVRVSGTNYSSAFRSVPDKDNWQSLRFVALADSETEPEGRVVRRAWYPADVASRPAGVTVPWKDKFGTTIDNGFEILNYPLTEERGYQENLKIINQRAPEFLLMPGDLVQGGGYQPGWDEFFRQNAGELGAGLSFYPIIPALGNWENFGAINGGYGFNEKGDYNPRLGRERFHSYFETPISDPLQKHRKSYYRVDYGPVTILTLDSSNGTPDATRSDTPEEAKLKNQEYTGPGTDTQENFTQSEYNSNGGADLSSFGPGSDQYVWLEENLNDARESGQLIFVQFHHTPYSSGEHGVPMNHELSTGQGGTPLRVLHPLFEEAGVIAVLSGHDELFERSFVDEDNDGKGVLYYDVGVAGDGLRGEKRNLTQDPLSLLNYNSFKQWTADQNSPEQWDESGANPILTDGGKHYGHLEVNLERVSEGNDTFAKIKFSPVYVFPVLDQTYNLQRVERRVYDDEIEVSVLLATSDFVPEFKDSVSIFLDDITEEGDFPFVTFSSTATLSPEDFLVELPEEEFEYNSARGFEFECSDLGKNEFQISATNVRTGEVWVHDLELYVIDDITPELSLSEGNLEFDPLIGELSIEIFDFEPLIEFDNCSNGYEYEISLTSISCEDIDWRTGDKTFEISATVEDFAGNVSDPYVTSANIRWVPSDTISLEAKGSLFVGSSVELALGNEYEFEVLSWFKEGSGIIEGAKGNNIFVDETGSYFAEIVTESGCPLISEVLFIEAEDVPFPPLKDEIILNLDEEGMVSIMPEDVFETWPPEDETLSFEFSQTDFTCEDIGEQEIDLVVSDSENNTWELSFFVLIQDEIPPVLVTKNIEVNLDRVTGEIELIPDELIESLTDNCGIGPITLIPAVITCEDINSQKEIVVRASDLAGNITEGVSIVEVVGSVGAEVITTGTEKLCQGEAGELTLSSEAAFEVIEWRQNGDPLAGETGTNIEISEPGVYDALVRFEGGCLWESQAFEVEGDGLPEGDIEVNGFLLTAPEGDINYQWFKNGAPINGAESRNLTVSEPGNYSVELSNEGDCNKTLGPVEFTENDFDLPFPPLKTEFELSIGEDGVGIINPEDAFTSWPPEDENLEITFSQSEFSCEDVGQSFGLVVTIKDQDGREWQRLTQVNVVDDLPPVLIVENIEVGLDLVEGELILDAEDFIVEVSDNCELEEVTINRSVFTCEDLGEEIDIEIIARDIYENITARVATVTLVPESSSPVEISGNNELCEGEVAVLSIDSDADFEVILWRRNGNEIQGETGLSLETDEPGVYHAVIRYLGGCISESTEIEVEVQEIPSGQIEEDGNILRAPEGDFDFRWFRNGELIPNETTRTLIVDQMGTYGVELTTSFGCVASLDPVELTISSIGGRPLIEPKAIDIYPNPGQSRVSVSIEGDETFVLSSFEIYSQEGRDVSSMVRISTRSNTDYELAIDLLPQGMYLVWLRGEGQQVYFGKLIKR